MTGIIFSYTPIRIPYFPSGGPAPTLHADR